jgi:hypothetical protein
MPVPRDRSRGAVTANGEIRPDAETPVGIASTPTAAPSKSNFFTVNLP